MEINNKKQYNQVIGKYKTLSSTAGVGSLITTKWGGFIMPLSISNWQFAKTLSNKISLPRYSDFTPQDLEVDIGVEIIDDKRFIDFLQQKKKMTSLKYFIAIPHVQLDMYNQIDISEHPLHKKKKESDNIGLTPEMLTIPAINFPKWFISNNYELKSIDDWIEIWKKNKCNDGKLDFFAPPRDPYNKTYRNLKHERVSDKTIYGLLKPVPMVLICPNGHISDIPWYEYFCAKLEGEKIDEGFDLFNYECSPCEQSPNNKHNIQWITNRNQSESWGTLKCSHCQRTVSLAGIMNLKPVCQGERPWDLDNPKEDCKTGKERTIMQMALVTSNSIYYANNLTSLYIPYEYITESNSNEAEDIDILTTYRFNEYQVLANNTSTPGNKPGLNFNDIDLSDSLAKYFTKIQKIDNLAITTTQLGFSRVSMPSPIIVNRKVIYPDEKIKPIYNCRKEEVLVLPANKLFGEGIFFMFDNDKVNKWAEDYDLEKYYECNLDDNDISKFLYDEMGQYGKARFYLIHTFSHVIMRELEFTCGYPTASLHERIYYSDKMCGILIYTADGAEGSMGGLVRQGESNIIERIIKSAMNRALNCSSDPMCWENEYGLNKATCFSCTMISETSCEQRNLGLDRRALVDNKYGYFKDLIKNK